MSYCTVLLCIVLNSTWNNTVMYLVLYCTVLYSTFYQRIHFLTVPGLLLYSSFQHILLYCTTTLVTLLYCTLLHLVHHFTFTEWKPQQKRHALPNQATVSRTLPRHPENLLKCYPTTTLIYRNITQPNPCRTPTRSI